MTKKKSTSDRALDAFYGAAAMTTGGLTTLIGKDIIRAPSWSTLGETGRQKLGRMGRGGAVAALGLGMIGFGAGVVRGSLKKDKDYKDTWTDKNGKVYHRKDTGVRTRGQ